MKLQDINNILILGSGTLGLRIGLASAINNYKVKIYDIPLSEEQVKAAYNSFNSNAEYFAEVDMDKRVFPKGENMVFIF